MLPESVEILAVLVAILDSVVFTRPERVEMFELVVAMLPVIDATVPLIAFCARESVK